MRRIYGDELTPRFRGLIEQMSEEAAKLYKSAIDAYLDEDDALAAAIDDMDDVPRRPPEGLHRGGHRRPRGRPDRPERGGAAGPHRPVLRAHRRPRRQHGRAGPVPGHRLAPRAGRPRRWPRPARSTGPALSRRPSCRAVRGRRVGPCASSSPTTTASTSRGLGVLAGAVAAAGHDVRGGRARPGPERLWRRHRPVAPRRAHRRPGRRAARTPPTSRAMAVRGTPALAVFAANLGAFGPAPDLVVSGINPGLNTGRATLHSGTVGAALTAANLGRLGPGREPGLRRPDALGDGRRPGRARPSVGWRPRPTGPCST